MWRRGEEGRGRGLAEVVMGSAGAAEYLETCLLSQSLKQQVMGTQIGEGELSNHRITQTVAWEPGLPGT